jgi:hypothetical protein
MSEARSVQAPDRLGRREPLKAQNGGQYAVRYAGHEQ